MKAVKKIFSVAIACMSLAACEGGWLKEDKEQFLQSCRLGRQAPAGTVETYCQCRLEQTIKVYPTINGLLENYDSAKLRVAYMACDPH